ncbi:Vacuolar protein sorting-associated protein 27 [Leucoagaricus sp. SymC.cos]|nr:Vacuolar protein sorting-associated protein 27 [Leucoagaricus sp. SymC.cos]
MSGLGAWLWGTSQLDDAIDKATSELLPAGSEDIALNLEICDQIRSKSVPAKDAMRALKRRLNHKNPNVQLLALGLTDICVKNGGDHFLVEIASREFIDNLVSILKIPGLNHDLKNTILRLIQNWSVAFEGKYSLGYVGQVYKTLQGEGYKFPPKDQAAASAAMVDTQTAPEWIDSDVCLRCRTPFTFTNRKHHCRNCGQVFDQQCSSKSLPLPHFGITQEVRVCDGCYNKLTRKADKVDKDKRHRSSHSTPNSSRHKSAQELADAELQRAIELSLQESKSPRGYAYSNPSSWQPSEPPIVESRPYSDRKTAVDDEDDPDLKAAIEASLREANAPQPSAPLEIPKIEHAPYNYVPTQPPLPKVPTYDLDPTETDAILTFNQTVGQVEANGGRDLSRYPAVTELYEKASRLRPKLALSVDDAGRKEQMLSEMHDKLSQAVKLYDQILTEQVMHPRWRASRSPPRQFQPLSSTSTSNYTQWQAPSQTPVPQPPQTPQTQYTPQPPPIQQQQQYIPPTQHHVASPPPPMQQTLQRSQSLISAPPPRQPTTYTPSPMATIASAPPPQQSTPVAYTQPAPPPPAQTYTATPQPPQQQNLDKTKYHDTFLQTFKFTFSDGNVTFSAGGTQYGAEYTTYALAGSADAPLVVVCDFGCAAGDFPIDTSGKITLISRGNCSFSDKIALSGSAGALAAIVY